jgi:ArsR family transcriptional regulator, virulence genes transcriptional regulator
MSGEKIFETQAELCRAMGSALRQEIMHLLRDKPMSVSDIASATGQPQGTISRNLGTLRNAGVVVTHRTRNIVLYQVADPKLMQACDLMRKVLEEKIAHAAQLMDQF